MYFINDPMFNILQLTQNLQKHLDPSTHVMANNTALGCHSAGCDVTLQMVQANSSIANVGVECCNVIRGSRKNIHSITFDVI